MRAVSQFSKGLSNDMSHDMSLWCILFHMSYSTYMIWHVSNSIYHSLLANAQKGLSNDVTWHVILHVSYSIYHMSCMIFHIYYMTMSCLQTHISFAISRCSIRTIEWYVTCHMPCMIYQSIQLLIPYAIFQPAYCSYVICYDKYIPWHIYITWHIKRKISWTLTPAYLAKPNLTEKRQNHQVSSSRANVFLHKFGANRPVERHPDKLIDLIIHAM